MKRELFYKVLLLLCRVSTGFYSIKFAFYKQVESIIHSGTRFNVLRATLMMIKAVWNYMLCLGCISCQLQEQAGSASHKS
jgi:hypothetical protein